MCCISYLICHRRGYDVVAAIDGSGTINQTVREAAISRMIQAGATIMTWFPIMAELQGDWKKSTAPDMVRLLTEHAIKYSLIVSSYVANKPDQTIVPKDFKA
jgi:hypothetical protein